MSLLGGQQTEDTEDRGEREGRSHPAEVAKGHAPGEVTVSGQNPAGVHELV